MASKTFTEKPILTEDIYTERIFKCFIENNYEEKFNTNIETVLSALIGTDAKDTEMNKYNVVKKNYISKLKKIRFFDHEHISKK